MRTTILVLYSIVNLVSLIYGSYSLSYAQRDTLACDRVKSLQLQKTQSEFALPVLQLGSREKLRLGFDELSDSPSRRYVYQIQHCNRDWIPSELRDYEFMSGNATGRVVDVQFSVHTTESYLHYSLEFPDEMSAFRVSGNYWIEVYDEDDPSTLIFRKQFYVLDTKLEIQAEAKKPAQDQRSKQEIFVQLYPQNRENMYYFQPRELSVYVQQNRRKDRLHLLKISEQRAQYYAYNWGEANLFDGGNEFRNFDIKNIKNRSRFVSKLDFSAGQKQVFLLPEVNRSMLQYTIDEDIDGKMKIHADFTSNSDLEGDYAWVHFSLPLKQVRLDGKFYILGELTQWTVDKNSEMAWDFEEKVYQQALFLKQGYYNYQIVFLSNDTKEADETMLEGNHVETENEYSVFVYYRPSYERHDQLIGFKTVKSLLGNVK